MVQCGVFRDTNELVAEIRIPALARPTLDELRERYHDVIQLSKADHAVERIEFDDSPTGPVVLAIGTVLCEGEDGIDDDEYEHRLKAIDGKFGYQHGLWLVEHQDEFPDLKLLRGKFYKIDLPGIVVVFSLNGRRRPFLQNDGGTPLCLYWQDTVGFYSDGRVACSRA